MKNVRKRGRGLLAVLARIAVFAAAGAVLTTKGRANVLAPPPSFEVPWLEESDARAFLRAAMGAIGHDRSDGPPDVGGAESRPENVRLHELLRAAILDGRGDPEGAKIYERLLAGAPEDPVLNLRAGVSSFWRHQPKEALERLLKAWRIGRAPEAAYYLGRTLSSLGHEPEARWFWAYCYASEGNDALSGRGGWHDHCQLELGDSLERSGHPR